MITVRIKSDKADLDYEINVSPEQAYQVIKFIAGNEFPSKDDFLARYVWGDIDYNPLRHMN